MSPGQSSRPRVPRRRSLPILVTVVLVIASLSLAVILLSGRRDVDLVTAAGDDPGVAHVHGLGINPGDGAVYAATHLGLFRIPARGRAVRIADRFQDTMGFTVVGEDRFLGSGHPDINDTRLRKPGRPPLLGLIESTDAGETWQPRSLLGEADFHALVADHGVVYGFDATSGGFMVSSDTKTWDRRSTLELASFAVDPSDGDHVVAASPAGLLESRDGGRTWPAMEGPRLVALSWDGRSGLWGADLAGNVYQLPPDGGRWVQAGSAPGEPQALLAKDGRIIVAAAERDGATGIYESADGSAWKLLYRDRNA